MKGYLETGPTATAKKSNLKSYEFLRISDIRLSLSAVGPTYTLLQSSHTKSVCAYERATLVGMLLTKRLRMLNAMTEIPISMIKHPT